MRKSEELTNPASCMSRARADEMTFVLLARDIAAPATIRFWIGERVRLGKNRLSDPQIAEAEQCAVVMESQGPHADRLGMMENVVRALAAVSEMSTEEAMPKFLAVRQLAIDTLTNENAGGGSTLGCCRESEVSP